MFEVGLRERAFFLECLVDDLIERRIVTGRVVVPDFVVARRSELGQGADLTERDFGERNRPFVLVAGHVHVFAPIALESHNNS